MVHERSPNCAEGATPTTLFTVFAHNRHNPDQEHNTVILSCQPPTTNSLPDGPTRLRILEMAKEAIALEHNEALAQKDIMIETHPHLLGDNGTKAIAQRLALRIQDPNPPGAEECCLM